VTPVTAPESKRQQSPSKAGQDLSNGIHVAVGPEAVAPRRPGQRQAGDMMHDPLRTRLGRTL
jgi:hypothetical protein